jgi:hypothetical protein
VVSASAAILARIAELCAPLVADVDALTAELSGRDQQLVRRCLEAIVALSEKRVNDLVADIEAAQIVPDEDVLHLWA